MNYYKVLLVDDEQDIIDVISKKINWEEMGFTICGCATNGLEAIETARQMVPDVVLTDIKMPYMDGLEASKELKELYPDIRIIIYSGFDEFEFAKEAIALGVSEYLLKPINSDEIVRVFTKIHKEIDDERERRSSRSKLEQYYQNSLPTLREIFFTYLMEGGLTPDRISEMKDDYQLDLDSPYYVVSVVHRSSTDSGDELSSRLRDISIKNLVEEWEEKNGNSFVFTFRDNVCILTKLPNDDLTQFTDESDKLARLAKHSLDATITVGIGRPVNSLALLYSSYGGAREAVSYRVMYGTGTAINITEIAPYESVTVDNSNYLDDILKQIKMGTEEKLIETINDTVDKLSAANLNIDSYRMLLMEIASGFFKFCSTNQINNYLLSNGGKDTYNELTNLETIDDLRQWLLTSAVSARTEIHSKRNTKTKSLVNEAIDFVNSNYNNPDLSIDMVCSKLCVSAAYFSTVFKKETGKTFGNYLTEFRMTEAIRLLMEEDEKTYIVAEKVGYSDANYFSYVFKKQFGMSPTAYKKK